MEGPQGSTSAPGNPRNLREVTRTVLVSTAQFYHQFSESCLCGVFDRGRATGTVSVGQYFSKQRTSDTDIPRAGRRGLTSSKLRCNLYILFIIFFFNLISYQATCANCFFSWSLTSRCQAGGTHSFQECTRCHFISQKPFCLRVGINYRHRLSQNSAAKSEMLLLVKDKGGNDRETPQGRKSCWKLFAQGVSAPPAHPSLPISLYCLSLAR